MMVRLLGAAALLLSACLLGRVSTIELRCRPERLHRLIDALEQLRAEISALTPLSDALRRASGCADESKAVFLDISRRLETENTRFQVLWEEALQSLRFLQPSERQILTPLGVQLGQFDAASQVRALDRCMEELTKCETDARNQARTAIGLRLRLTAAMGALLLIMIW